MAQSTLLRAVPAGDLFDFNQPDMTKGEGNSRHSNHFPNRHFQETEKFLAFLTQNRDGQLAGLGSEDFFPHLDF